MDGLLTVENLFSGRRFDVPDYQRGYAWGKDQWTDLLDDLEALPPTKDHFTGMVVLKAQEAAAQLVDIEGQQYRAYDVVDGQQRLTTLVLLLDAIRRELLTLAMQPLADGIKKSYVHFIDRAHQPVFKLHLNDGSQHFLESVVLADHPAPTGPTTNSERRLRDAREFFARYLTAQREQPDSEFAEWLPALHDKVTHHLRVNLYEVEDAAEVGVIFEVMNNRGKPLSELDLTKNYVLYLGTKLDVSEHSLHSDVVLALGSVFRDLMSADLTETWHEEQLLRAHWLMAYDYQRKNWDGTKSIKERFNLKTYVGRHEDLLTDLRRYLETLSWAANAYCDVYRPTRPGSFKSFENDQEVRRTIIRTSDSLTRMNVLAGFLPLLIGVRLAYPTDGSKYLSVLELCEAFAFRVFRLNRWRSHTGQSTLFKFAFQAYHSELSHDDLHRQLRATLHYYNSETAFRDAFELKDEENDWYRWPGIKYFLYEYEKFLSGDDNVWLRWEELEKSAREKTIEHILPQTPTDYWTERFDEEERERLTHDLGNLALTSDNSSYGNKTFPEKKGTPGQSTPCYANAPYKMERYLAQFADWTSVELITRRESMVAWALERWGVEEEKADEADAVLNVIEVDDDDQEHEVVAA
jgi:hypothetical protein